MKAPGKKKFFIEDNVCTPYKLILNRAHNYLTMNGMFVTENRKEADTIIIGTCAAFQSLENTTISFIEKAQEEKKNDAELVIFGCMNGINPTKVKSYKPDRIIPASAWERLELLIDNPKIPLADIPEATRFRSDKDYRLPDYGKQFVLLQTGCSSNCPFCPHKMGIGKLKSNTPANIMKQINSMGDEVHTLCLTGNDTGSYGVDIGTSFPELLKKILATTNYHIHLSQINPNWVYYYRDELYPLLLDNKVREFQTLIQSSSNRVLVAMERDPVVEKIKPYLLKLKKERPDLILRTDLIIGYPTSTEEEELESAKYVAEIFHEVAVHGFERFSHSRIERLGLPFYEPSEINHRVQKIINYFADYPQLLVHHGGQVIESLEAIEKPKQYLRDKNNISLKCGGSL